MKRFAWLAGTAAVLAAFGVGLLLAAVPQRRRGSPSPRPSTSPAQVTPAAEATWAEVDRLVKEQKYEAASEVVGRIRVRAQVQGDEADWTRALVREVQLRTALHGYETTVRFLRETPWPQGAFPTVVLDLFYGQTLVDYLAAYGYEIRQRERIDSKDPLDLKKWTAAEIAAEAERAYTRAWAQREAVGAEPSSRFGDFLQHGSYPERVRGTVRDVIAYLLVELVADSSHWSPEQGELYRLDLKTLLGPVEARVDDPAAHPLVRVAAALTDLEAWHASQGRREAALEAKLERLRRLHAAFTAADERTLVRQELERRLARERDVEWWSVGQALRAQLTKEEDAPDALVRARRLAQEGERAYPASIGGQQCRAVVAEIEAPSYQLQSMTLDASRRRSVQVEHKNLPRLFFRAYAVDLADRLRRAKDYNLLPGWREVQELVTGGRPAAAWSADLAPTPDFRQHRTFVTPPLDTPGLYVLVASGRPEFNRASGENHLEGVNLVIGDLVLVQRSPGDVLETTALSGRTGAPVAGAAVELWRLDWQKGHELLLTRATEADGTVRFSESEAGRAETRGYGLALLARQGRDVSLAGQVSWNVIRKPSAARASLVYTDRSVYRPQQKLLWKVVAYEGGGEDGRFHTVPAASLTVSLLDANGQAVESKTVATNAYGSAAGDFVIPPGRLLGLWTLRSSLGGQAMVRVEEYKRPTFEVSLLDPEKEIRLNAKAALRGEARYYFGLPVTSGKVSWRVTREAIRPWWWWGWRSSPAEGSRIVAAGEATLGPDGRFPITFTPEADPRASQSFTWSYSVAADVTDEGGETRSASRAFRLGFVSVQARIEDPPGFVLAGRPASLAIARTDLDGTARAGAGTWTLFALKQPATTLLPAEQPVSVGADEPPDSTPTPGDTLRPRQQPGYAPAEVLRSWADGATVSTGTLSHDAKGMAALALPPLSSGAYRLRYETKDAAGATYRMAYELVVAQARDTALALPGVLSVERSSVPVGGTARLFAHSGVPGQPITLEFWRGGRRTEVRRLVAGRTADVIEVPITTAERGGFGVSLTLVRDHQLVQQQAAVFVPWDDRALEVSFATFRDRLRPGSRETWRITVSGGDPQKTPAAEAEVLASMYDRSLDLFAPHQPTDARSVYPTRTGTGYIAANLSGAGAVWSDGWISYVPGPVLTPDQLAFWSGYGIGGPGVRAMARGRLLDGANAAVAESVTVSGDRASVLKSAGVAGGKDERDAFEAKQGLAGAPTPPPPPPASAAVEVRSEFSETAFWEPQLLTGPDGAATFEFTVPDSVTSWTVWTQAITRDLRAGAARTETRTVKDLMVRPYLPRFLREGDRAEVRVVVNNASERPLRGTLSFEITDPETNRSLAEDFGLDKARSLTFDAPPSASASVAVPLVTPKRLGAVAVKVVARSGDLSDGELRPLPVLPSRLHLVESRFAAVKGASERTLAFPALARGDDPTRQTEQLVVTLDAQLFYGMLQALPYLIDYPYECTEQTLNRFVSTGILSSLFSRYPSVARMAAEMSKRDTRLEVWDANDPNRRMQLEESPWLVRSRGGKEGPEELIKVLDPKIAAATRQDALGKLRKAQTSLGAFPWWPGGPPSPYMTLYTVYGLSKAREFGVEVPKDMVVKAFAYLHRHYLDDWVRSSMSCDCGWEFVTFLGYVLSSFPDDSWTGGVFTPAERTQMLDFSFKHWKDHSPYLKGQLALTLHRRGRPRDAQLVWDSVMDSAKTDADTGTSWAPEDRAWLWYNDTTETHAFALRTLAELAPKDPRREGLVQWLFLHKKLNHWDSTRSTAEVLYSLAHYLKQENQLGVREDATVRVGSQTSTFVFEPDTYTGRNNQLVVAGARADAEKAGAVNVSKTTPGLLFASATWHYATDRLPTDEAGDLFAVSRRYFRRENKEGTFTLTPIAEGARLAVGDEVEVQLSLRARQAAEYVHLRDPRGAGFEPVSLVSGFKWQTGLGLYEEVRDSGQNFFFEWLPAGEYTFRYRLRAATAGTFRVGPAQLQSMYAPEFAARSAGNVLEVGASR